MHNELKVMLSGMKIYTYYNVSPDMRDRLARFLKYGQIAKFYRAIRSL